MHLSCIWTSVCIRAVCTYIHGLFSLPSLPPSSWCPLSFPLSHFPCQVELPKGEFSVSAADDVGDMLETSEEEVDPEAAK